jgi:hypothetical protein
MNNNITTKKAFLLLACIWFIITFSIIQTTYAKYVTNLNANTNISISYWNILVNEQDIVENSDISETITCVLPGNTYSKADVLVPGSTGYFDLNINSSEVNVPFKLTVTSAVNETSSLTTDLKVSGYSIDGGDIVELADDVLDFSCNIAQDTDSTLIRVYTTWVDDGLDSKEDTALGITGGTAILDVTLDFEQIIN